MKCVTVKSYRMQLRLHRILTTQQLLSVLISLGNDAGKTDDGREQNGTPRHVADSFGRHRGSRWLVRCKATAAADWLTYELPKVRTCAPCTARRYHGSKMLVGYAASLPMKKAAGESGTSICSLHSAWSDFRCKCEVMCENKSGVHRRHTYSE